MSLFDEPIRVRFSIEEWQVVTRPINGEGGAQGLLRACLDCFLEDRVLLLERQELDKCHQYAWDYGGGGFQERFRTIEAAARRAGWTAPDNVLTDRRPDGGGAFGHRK